MLRIMILWCILLLFLSTAWMGEGWAAETPNPLNPADNVSSLKPKRPEAEVIKIASGFCNKLGVKLSEPVKAEYAVPSAAKSDFWPVRWTVSYGDSAVLVEVGDVDGKIYSFRDRVGREENRKKYTPLKQGDRKTPEEIVKLATQALELCGTMNELTYDFTTLFPGAAPFYGVLWMRMFKASEDKIFSYKDPQGVTVALDPLSGEVFAIETTFLIPSPSSSQIKIGFLEAIEIANQYMTAKRLTYVEKGSGLSIVQPNTFWESYGKEGVEIVKKLPLSRIAYTCRYNVGKDRMQVWVDAETSKVIGGSKESLGR